MKQRVNIRGNEGFVFFSPKERITALQTYYFGAMIEPMRMLRGSVKERGASVLAAVILVAILGAAFVVLQYVRSSGNFAYESAALTAATAAAPDVKAPPLQGGETDASGQTIYPCGQSEAHSKVGDAINASVEACLPGCEYRITPGNPPHISAVAPKAYSDPSKKSCTTQVCSSDGNCTNVDDKMVGHSLSEDTRALTAISIMKAESPEVATQISQTYSSNSGDMSQLSADLNYLQGGRAEPLSGPQQDNVDAVLKSLGAESPSPDTTAVPPSDPNLTQLDKDLKYAGGINPYEKNNPPAGGSGDPCALTGGMNDSSGRPCSNSTDVPSNGGASGDPCSLTNGMNDSRGRPCSGSVSSTFPPSPPPKPPADPAAPPGPPAPKGFQLPDLSGAASLGIPFLTGFLKGMNQSSAAQQHQQAAQAAQSAANAPYGRGNDGNACFQPQPQPPSSSCTVGYWQQQRQNNGCPTSWSCVPNGGSVNPAVQPSAALSCQPQTADVGTTISMSYACTNATTSYGAGFSTGGQPSGSVTTVITPPPSGAATASYTLTCINQSLTASAQCAIQINQPTIVLIANPSVVPSGASTAIGWVTTGMHACTISSPDSVSFTAANANNQSINGVATTSSLTSTMHVVLNCETLNGGTRQATAVISIGTGSTAAGAVSISSAVDGGSIAHGTSDRITWSTTGAPAGSAISLWLVNMQTHHTQAVIAGGFAPSGVYTWNIPSLGAPCNANASNVCAADIVNGSTYSIEAVLYTPSNAYVGDGTAPASPIQPTYGNSGVTGSFTIHD